jgi:hypothetical protein
VDGTAVDLECQADVVVPNDDGSGPRTALPFAIDFFGRRFTAVWGNNNNGNVTFDGGQSVFTPLRPDHYGRVGYFNARNDKLNSFHLFLVDRADVAPGAFDIVFSYRQLQWETGGASGGTGGLGGTSAAVGYANGSGAPGTFLEVTGSRVPGSFLDGAPTGLSRTSTNSTRAGVHVFPVRTP